jgi:hypothetical protein
MTTELYMALLSMDAYNRGYGQRVDVVANGASVTQLGNVAIGLNSFEDAAGLPTGVAAGFFAQTYTLNGQKIISYRGTDELSPPPPWPRQSPIPINSIPAGNSRHGSV